MKMVNTRFRCGVCRHPEFEVSSGQYPGGLGDGRPRFKCTNCGNTWTCGLNGGNFLKFAVSRPPRRFRDLVKKRKS